MNELRFLTVADALRGSSAQFERVISAAFDEAVTSMTIDQKRNAFFPELVGTVDAALIAKIAA
ncbi:hypothetical protein [Neopusillimonas maritima]|jgi:hypothetical protein|uniref:Uncharacterized protein n=1 Tax=Neopusillimonas maritima TaxID=2026239 RepID=A0A3A1YWN6_9BURK|nr:hypothetical protein [Neopusillimonas maritima]RIY41931.1 hypothetical protein CJP73_00345 [Neopusillimonas maritima]